MKTQELNLEELRSVNGGSLFGSNDSSSSSSLVGMLGVDNLLSFSQSSQDGDESQSSSFSLGNGIGLNIGNMFNQLTQ